ncbi:MAG: non-canonical purine NTP pyrophosphatase, partial [Gillisia sp.]
NRNARFKTVIALNLGEKSEIFTGICAGEILKEQKGSDGFGYDPVFKPEGKSETFAQMSSEEKNRLSHRGLALKKLIEYLSK